LRGTFADSGKFVIQSDFITETSREDVPDCPWNNRLLDEAANAFFNSISGSSGFLTHPTLKYHWVRYLPFDDIADNFWRRLKEKILAKVIFSPFFFAANRSPPQIAGRLRFVPGLFRDENGEPLLADILSGDSAYISESYDQDKDLPILRKMGTADLYVSEFLERLAADLDNQNGRMRSISTEPKWHTTVADLLSACLENSFNREQIHRLPIVPVKGGNWAKGPLYATIYFPPVGGVEIPSDLPIHLVDSNALISESRKTLFSKLGVTEWAPERVFPLIEQQYDRNSVSFKESLEHIAFLFWHHDKLPQPIVSVNIRPENPGQTGWFNSLVQGGCWTYSHHSEDRYSMYNILNGLIPNELAHCIRIPNHEYYEKLERFERRNNKTAKEWLDNFLRVKQTPQLHRMSSRGQERSPELKYIARHVPEKLLGVLKQNWHQYHKSEEWDTYFKTTKVPIIQSEILCNLNDTFLPLPKLRSIVTRLHLEEGFGFLREMGAVTDETAMQWMFLERFGVGIQEDVRFWLRLLNQARKKESNDEKVVFEIYSRLQSFASTDSDALKYAIRLVEC
jgi:hypothetical protein